MVICMTQIEKLATFVGELIKVKDVDKLVTILNAACNTAQKVGNFQFSLNNYCITLLDKGDEGDEIQIYELGLAILVDDKGRRNIRMFK